MFISTNYCDKKIFNLFKLIKFFKNEKFLLNLDDFPLIYSIIIAVKCKEAHFGCLL